LTNLPISILLLNKGFVTRLAISLGRKGKKVWIYWWTQGQENDETRAGQDLVGPASTEYVRLRRIDAILLSNGSAL
jgi:hypothetical protein